MANTSESSISQIVICYYINPYFIKAYLKKRVELRQKSLVLKGERIHSVECPPFLKKEDNFCDFLFAFCKWSSPKKNGGGGGGGGGEL